MRVKATTIKDLRKLLKLWTNNKCKNLYLTGYPGSGKSHTIKGLLNDKPRVVILEGHTSPKALYAEIVDCAARKAQYIVFDDTDGILKDPKGLAMLKQLLTDGERSTVKYSSTQLKGLPNEVTLTCQIAIITNMLHSPNYHVEAVKNRCLHIEYTPDPQQVVKNCIHDKLISKELGDKIDYIGYPSSGHISIRSLIRYQLLLEAGFDWETIYTEDRRST